MGFINGLSEGCGCVFGVIIAIIIIIAILVH